MKVNILGIKYKIIFADELEKPELSEIGGYMDWSVKEIVVKKIKRDPMSVKNLDVCTKRVMRHEIVHAFLYESGLWDESGRPDAWAKSEEITDWIAIQFPKMLKAFKEAGAL